MTAVATTTRKEAQADRPDPNVALASVLQNLTTLAQSAGAEAQHAISDSAIALAHMATTMLEEAKKQSSDIARGAAKEVKEHPITTAAAVTVAAAAVLGLVAVYQQNAAKSADASTGANSHADTEGGKKSKN